MFTKILKMKRPKLFLSRKFFDFEHWTGVDVMVKIVFPAIILTILGLALMYCYLSEPIPK